jgi:hypothetical protein
MHETSLLRRKIENEANIGIALYPIDAPLDSGLCGPATAADGLGMQKRLYIVEGPMMTKTIAMMG